MSLSLKGKTVAILTTDGFEQSELAEPKTALENAGAQTRTVSPAVPQVRGWKETDWGDLFPVDLPLVQADARNFNVLLLPGGVINSDRLRLHSKAIEFVNSFFHAGKPVGAISHGPSILIEAGAAKGRRMTSHPSIRTDLKNAGAIWVDEAVTEDNGLVTSRSPSDLPAFIQMLIQVFAGGLHRTHPVSLFESGLAE